MLRVFLAYKLVARRIRLGGGGGVLVDIVGLEFKFLVNEKQLIDNLVTFLSLKCEEYA